MRTKMKTGGVMKIINLLARMCCVAIFVAIVAVNSLSQPSARSSVRDDAAALQAEGKKLEEESVALGFEGAKLNSELISLNTNGQLLKQAEANNAAERAKLDSDWAKWRKFRDDHNANPCKYPPGHADQCKWYEDEKAAGESQYGVLNQREANQKFLEQSVANQRSQYTQDVLKNANRRKQNNADSLENEQKTRNLVERVRAFARDSRILRDLTVKTKAASACSSKGLADDDGLEQAHHCLQVIWDAANPTTPRSKGLRPRGTRVYP